MKAQLPITKKAIKHSTLGDFVYPKMFFPHKILTMKSGGHGQENISFLNSKNMSYNIDTLYSNGVRLGHINKHLRKRDKHRNGHAWFPSTWSTNDIIKAGQHVASLKRNKTPIDGKKTGRYQGVTTAITIRKGKIKTIFPFFDVNKHAHKKAHIIFPK